MATIKSYTDIEQSKKLAKILPIESADMYFHNNYYTQEWSVHITQDFEDEELNEARLSLKDYLPCWSLAELLGQLPYELCDDDGNSSYLHINKEDDLYQLIYTDPYENFESIETDKYEEFVDACYDLILKLHELNLL